MLNQIVFYSGKTKREDGFFYKSNKEWFKEVCLTQRQVRYATKKLVEKVLIETKLFRANGALQRSTINFVLTILSQSLTESTSDNTTDDKKIIVNEQDAIPFLKIIDYLNNKANTNFKANSQISKAKITARWNEGYRLDDFAHVIDVKENEWLNDPKWSKYLRPDTLFGTKFENYRNQKEVVVKHATNRQRAEAFRRESDLPF